MNDTDERCLDCGWTNGHDLRCPKWRPVLDARQQNDAAFAAFAAHYNTVWSKGHGNVMEWWKQPPPVHESHQADDEEK